MEERSRALIIDDEEGIRYTFRKFLEGDGWEVDTAGSPAEFLARMNGSRYDVVFADIVLQGASGVDVLRAAKELRVTAPIVMITGMPTIETAAESLRLGAYDYLQKPVNKDALLRTAGLALRHKRLRDESERYRANLEAVFQNVRDGIITTDRDFRITAFNEAAADLCGLRQEHLGSSYGEGTLSCPVGCGETLREAVRRGQPIERFRIECSHATRSVQIVDLTAAPLTDGKGGLLGGLLVIQNKTRLARLEEQQADAGGFGNIVGAGPAMKKIYSLIQEVAEINSTVLLTGETGTGKELVAEAIHGSGRRSGRPIVRVNCAALPDELLASELFGHVRGAFTGAVRDQAGRFQMADGGTIFLDEISDISPRLQVLLLRVLQEKQFERLGDARTISVDVRVIAASNRDLKKKVDDGSFREDLYYRLNVINIHLPPLRERREDIPLLVAHFLKEYNGRFGRSIEGVSQDVQRYFLGHPWPGNVRQLGHVLETAVALCRDRLIMMDHLPGDFRAAGGIAPEPDLPAENGASAIRRALDQAGGNKAKAARILGISRQTFYRKMKELGLTSSE